MELEVLPDELTVCQVTDLNDINFKSVFYFIGRTDREISLVCPTRDTPSRTVAREDGWRGFRIRGTLDFSLVGVLSRLSGALAESGIGIFAVSTYDTDYILVKKEHLNLSLDVLAAKGYNIIQADNVVMKRIRI